MHDLPLHRPGGDHLGIQAGVQQDYLCSLPPGERVVKDLGGGLNTRGPKPWDLTGVFKYIFIIF